MTASIRHSGIVVNDIERFEKLFQLLGFKSVYSEIEQGEDIENLLNSKETIIIIKMEDEKGNIVEFLKYNRSTPEIQFNKQPWTNGINHIALSVTNLKSMIDVFHEFNGKLVGKIVEKRAVRLCYIRDFEDNLFELVEEK
jgi:hypothetical protein